MAMPSQRILIVVLVKLIVVNKGRHVTFEIL